MDHRSMIHRNEGRKETTNDKHSIKILPQMEESLYQQTFNINIYSRHFMKPQYIFFLENDTMLDLMDKLEIDLETLKRWNRKADLRGNLLASKDAVRNRKIYTSNGNSFPFNPKTLEIDSEQIDTAKIEEFEGNTIVTIVGFPLTALQLEALLDVRERRAKEGVFGKESVDGSPFSEKTVFIEGPIGLTEIVVRGYAPRSSSRGDRNVTRVSGPEQAQSFVRQFYLISDYHQHLSKCFRPDEKTINIVDFLERVMDADPEFVDKRIRDEPIDFFLEVSDPGDFRRDVSQYGFNIPDPFSSGEQQKQTESESYLMDIRRALYACFQYYKQSCKDKFNRYHWSDSRFRGVFQEWLMFVQKYRNILRFWAMLGKSAKEELKETLVEKMFEEANQLMAKTPNDIDDLFRIAKITKQLDNIFYPDLARKIKSYYSTLFSTKWISVKKKFTSIYAEFKKGKDVTNDALKITLEILLTISYLMDAYVIARSFREFRKPGREGSPLKNIIIYAGDKHIETMVTLLKELGEVEDDKKDERQKSESRTMQVDFQCLEVRVPLFVL